MKKELDVGKPDVYPIGTVRKTSYAPLLILGALPVHSPYAYSLILTHLI